MTDTDTKVSGRHIWRIFSAVAHRQERDPESKTLSVRLLADVQRGPKTPIETQIAATLTEAGTLSYDGLVQRVVTDLYQAELHRGAAVLDIGIFGSRLFERDVVSALKNSDGVLWVIG
jgi:hypothetical protein